MKPLKTMCLFIILLLIINACATSGEKTSGIIKKEPHEEIVHDTFTIKPGGSHEECIELQHGMIFDYQYDASDSLNFNIHYHAADGLHYPVDTKGRSFGKGMIDPDTHPYYTEEQEFYCLMWDNVSHEPVKVSFRCTLKQMRKGESMRH